MATSSKNTGLPELVFQQPLGGIGKRESASFLKAMKNFLPEDKDHMKLMAEIIDAVGFIDQARRSLGDSAPDAKPFHFEYNGSRGSAKISLNVPLGEEIVFDAEHNKRPTIFRPGLWIQSLARLVEACNAAYEDTTESRQKALVDSRTATYGSIDDAALFPET